MSNYEQYYPRKLQPVASAMVQNSPDYRLYCLDSRFAGIARQLLIQCAKPYHFYGNLADTGYITPNSAQFDIIDGILSEGIGELMAGCGDLGEKLDNIEDAIRSLSLNCSVTNTGSQYAGPTAQPANPFVDTGSNYPSEYQDRPAFDYNRCNMANQIVQELIDDMDWLKTIDVLTLTALTFAGGLITPIPGDEIIYALAVLTTSLVLGNLLFNDASQVLILERDEIACALYGATSISDAYQRAYNRINESPFWDTDVYRVVMMQALQYWLNETSLNRLYDGTISTYSGGDCSGCSNSWVTIGNPKNNQYGIQTIYSELSQDGYQTIRIANNANARYISGDWKQPALYYFEIVSNEGYYVAQYPPLANTLFTNVTYWNQPQEAGIPFELLVEFV